MNYKHYRIKSEGLLPTIPDNSLDAILSDFPYGLKFMGKKWDYDLPSIESLEHHLRVLKPGAYLLGFSSARTYHRLVCRLEDVGFEIVDCIMWIYGSGFPKGLNISKAFDKLQNYVLRDKWGGYNTALKPAHEPIVVARKPLEGTYLENAEKWGVAGFNIDGCRIATNWGSDLNFRPNGKKPSQTVHTYGADTRTDHWFQNQGRYPSNVIISEWAASQLDVQSGVLKSGAKKPTVSKCKETIFKGMEDTVKEYPANEGGASRFFYVAKACPSDRNYGIPKGKKNTHPTVKPIKLMRYLVRLLKTPFKDCIIGDFYEGSGGTGIACMLEGVNYIGCEMEQESFETAEHRISYAYNEYKNINSHELERKIQ